MEVPEASGWLTEYALSNDTETGMSRLTLSDDDARVRAWLLDQARALGWESKIDKMGNIFIRRRGQAQSPAPMTAMGSHLDTQPRGGRYDGILGVLAGLEVLKTFHDHGFQTAYDVGLVNWTKYESKCF